MPTSQFFLLILREGRGEGPEAAPCSSSGFGLTTIQIKPFHSCLEFSLNSVPEQEGMQGREEGTQMKEELGFELEFGI